MKYILFIPFVILTMLLSGCFYPSENLSKNQVPNDLQLQMVQEAVDRYVEINGGLVPIITKENETPIFEKYIIDFSRMKQQNVLASVPGTAFQNGGVYQYVLITPESDPRVKLIDLRITDAVRKVQIRINTYRNNNIYPPFGEEVQEGVFTINHELIGLKTAPYIESPYSQKNLPLVMDTNGKVYIDYRQDLFEAITKFDYDSAQENDIRYILAENYPFVPAYSLPYTMKDDEPVFNLDK